MSKLSLRRAALGAVGLVGGALGGQLMVPPTEVEAAPVCDERFVLERVDGPVDAQGFWLEPGAATSATRFEGGMTIAHQERRYVLRLEAE